MDCRDLDRLAELSLDGETDLAEQAEIEAHLERCTECREKVEARGRVLSTIRRKLCESSDEVLAPHALRAQISTQLRVQDRQATPVRMSRMVPATLALGTIAVMTWSFSFQKPTLDPEEPVAHHSRNLPPEVRARDGERLEQLFQRNLRYPVRVPRVAPPSSPTVQLVGGRLSNIQNRDAAYIMYDDRGARISLFSYPVDGAISMPNDFAERRVGGRTMMVGKHRGYNVVAWESRDVLYSLVSEVDPSELLDLAATIE
jgi:anti-sigma factor RsiW